MDKLHTLKAEQRTVKKKINRTKHLMTNLERDMKDISDLNGQWANSMALKLKELSPE